MSRLYYDQTTGEIVLIYEGVDVEYPMPYVDGVGDYDSNYIDVETQTIAQKQPSTIAVDKTTCTANGADPVTFTNIPAGAKLTVYNTQQILDGTDLSLTFNFPANFIVRILHPQYLKYEVVIHAT